MLLYKRYLNIYLLLSFRRKTPTKTQFKANKKIGGKNNDKGKKTRNY